MGTRVDRSARPLKAVLSAASLSPRKRSTPIGRMIFSMGPYVGRKCGNRRQRRRLLTPERSQVRSLPRPPGQRGDRYR